MEPEAPAAAAAASDPEDGHYADDEEVAPSGATKDCMECHEEKPIEEFPRNRRRLDGRDNRCKPCTARMVSARLKGKAPVTEPTVASKACSRCGETKPASDFNANKVAPDGLCSYCRPCNAAAAAERRTKRPPVVEPTVASKVCSHCQQEKPASEFHRSRSYKDGLFGQCRSCCAAAAARRAKPLVAAPTVGAKCCSRCGIEKPASDFNINKTTSSGLTSHCKECIAAAAAERKKQKALVTEPTVAFKVCGRCRKRKKASDFHRTRTRSDGLSSSCKACRNSANSAARAAATGGGRAAGTSGSSDSGSGSGDGGDAPPAAPMLAAAVAGAAPAAAATKTCIECQEARPVAVFAADARKLDGLRDVCQPCRTAQLASARSSAGDAPVAGPTKVCRRCGETRPTTDFHRQLSRPDGLYSYCVFCASEYKLQRKAGRAAAAAEAAAVLAAQQAKAASEQLLPTKRSRDGRPRRRAAAAARRKVAYLDEDWSPKSSTYGGSAGAASSLDALAAVGAATTAAAEEQNAPAAPGEQRALLHQWSRGSVSDVQRLAVELWEAPAAAAAAPAPFGGAALGALSAPAAPNAPQTQQGLAQNAALAEAAKQHANQQALAGRLAEAAAAVGLRPIAVSGDRRSVSPDARQKSGSGGSGHSGARHVSGRMSGDEWWRSLLEPSGMSGNLRGGSPPSWDKEFDVRWYSGLGNIGGGSYTGGGWGGNSGAPKSAPSLDPPSSLLRGPPPPPGGSGDPSAAAFWAASFRDSVVSGLRGVSPLRGASADLFELGSTTSELTGVRGMSPVPGGSSDSLGCGGVVECRGGNLDNEHDATSPAKRLRTSTAPSLPTARIGSLSSADLCAVAQPPPQPALDIARLDPTASLNGSASNGGNGHGHGGSGIINGSGNGATSLPAPLRGAQSTIFPAGAAGVAANASFWATATSQALPAGGGGGLPDAPSARPTDGAMPPQGRHAATSGGTTQPPGWPVAAGAAAGGTGASSGRQSSLQQHGGSGSPGGGGNRAEQQPGGEDTPEHSHHSGSGGSSNSPDRTDGRPGEAKHDDNGLAHGSGEAAAAAPAALVAAAGQPGSARAADGRAAAAAAPSELTVPPPLKKRKLASPFQAAETPGAVAAAELALGPGSREPLEGLSPRASGSFKVSDQGAFKPYSSPGSSPVVHHGWDSADAQQ